ncbi:MAG: AMP-binding protein [Myxococcota bacterium]|nr:AMP-binding protein [Myxococcota bacterium]
MSASSFLSGILGALQRERHYTSGQLSTFREERLRRLLLHAKLNTAFWKERLANVNVDEKPSLQNIEPVTKKEMMSDVASTLASPSVSNEQITTWSEDMAKVGASMPGGLVLACTSGTTGDIGMFLKSKNEIAQMNGILMARILRDRLIPRELARFAFGRRYRMAMLVAQGGHFISNIMGNYRPVGSRPFVDLQSFSIMDSIEKVVYDLNRFRPHYIHSYPTFLEVMAHEKKRGRLCIDPEFISVGSEPFSLSARRSVVEAFPRAQTSETYGATECLAMANECSAGHLHINEDVCFLEAVDENNQPVPAGSASHHVLLTNLTSYAQPIIRYQLSDSITLDDTPCACGSPMMRVRVAGRTDDTLYLRDLNGEYAAFSPMPFEAVMLQIDGLRQYQIIHGVQNKLEVRIVCGEGRDFETIRRQTILALNHLFESRGCKDTISVTVKVVNEVVRDPVSHKIRQIFSQVPKPSGNPPV